MVDTKMLGAMPASVSRRAAFSILLAGANSSFPPKEVRSRCESGVSSIGFEDVQTTHWQANQRKMKERCDLKSQKPGAWTAQKQLVSPARRAPERGFHGPPRNRTRDESRFGLVESGHSKYDEVIRVTVKIWHVLLLSARRTARQRRDVKVPKDLKVGYVMGRRR